MIIQRQFSIQSGSPDKGGSLKRELTTKIKAGAILGGAVGGFTGGIAGLGLLAGKKPKYAATAFGVMTAGGAILGALSYGLTVLGADGRRAGAEKANMNTLLDYLFNQYDGFKENTENYDDIRLERYIVEDQDPNKFMVNFAYEDGKLIINLNKPSDAVLESLNDSLEAMVQYNRRADYTSKQINNGFIVYVICPSIDEAAGLIYNTIAETYIKVNAITQGLLNKANKGQKSFSSIRGAKKAVKAIATAENSKQVGKIAARINRQGLNRNSLSLIDAKGTEKVGRGLINELEKEAEIKLSKEAKKEALKNFKKSQRATAIENIKRGGKADKLPKF